MSNVVKRSLEISRHGDEDGTPPEMVPMVYHCFLFHVRTLSDMRSGLPGLEFEYTDQRGKQDVRLSGLCGAAKCGCEPDGAGPHKKLGQKAG